MCVSWISKAYVSLTMELLRKQANDVFLAAVNSVRPNQLLNKRIVKSGPSTYIIGNEKCEVHKNVYVVGFGKATLGMARVVEDALSDHIVCGIVSVPQGIQDIFRNCNQKDLLLSQTTKISVFEGAANNLPDANSQTAAHAISDLIKGLKESDLLIVLISGGGSALLPAPIPPITLQEKCQVINLLTSRGANINELNIVRKRLSLLKGGGLAKLSYPAKVISFILSDVINDPLDIIASGPTVPNTDSVQDALAVVNRYGVRDRLPSSVLEVLSKVSSNTDLSNIEVCKGFEHVTNHVIGSNTIALEAAKELATSLGFCTTTLTNSLQGEAKEVGEFLARIAYAIGGCYSNKGSFKDRLESDGICQTLPSESLNKLEKAVLSATRGKKPICILAGGETTVKLTGSGKGGRNQELSLACGVHLHKLVDKQPLKGVLITFLSAGTDGIDGPTDAAGACTSHDQVSKALELGFDAETYLSNNDSNTFYVNAAKDDLIKIGHTGTNVMDIQILLVVPPTCT